MSTLAPERERARRPGGRAVAIALLRWAPALVGLIVCTGLYVAAHTPLLSVVLYGLYLLVFAAIPGTLLWRMLRTKPKSFLEEVAAGTVLGLCLQTFIVWTLTPLGAQKFAPAWIAVVLLLCIIHPRLRGFWRSQAESGRTPMWMGWALAAISIVACWWVANNDWRGHPIEQIPGRPGEWFGVAHVDVYFLQAVTAAVRHGGTSFPNVAASPLNYELMASYHMADAVRWTGIDLTIMVQRLQPLPFLVLAILLCAVIAHRITDSAGGAVLGAGLAYLTNPPPLWAGTRSPLVSVASLNLGVSRSATMSVGQPVLLLLILLVIIAIGRRRATVAQLIAFAVVAFVAGGAKATLLPQLACGLLAALVIGWLIKGRRSGRLLMLLVITGLMLAVVLRLVLGTASRDLVPSLDVNVTHWTAFAVALAPFSAVSFSGFKIALMLVGWLLGVVAAIVAVVARRRDLRVWLLVGIGLSGFGGSLLASHPSLSQIWFIRGAWPILGMLAGIGVLEAVKALHSRRRVATVVVIVALALGLGAAWVVRQSFHAPVVGDDHIWVGLFAPYAVVVLICVGIGAVGTAVLWRLGRRGTTPWPGRPIIAGLVVSVVALQGGGALELADAGLFTRPPAQVFPAIDPQGAYVARWLRDNSGPHDTIATDMHCVYIQQSSRTPSRPKNATCDATHFWLSALSERQVLLEGWSYAPAPPGVNDPSFIASNGRSRMWDVDFLVKNDAAIVQPTPESMAWLRSQSVDWIVVDRSILMESPLLKNYAQLVLVRGHFAVYRVPPEPAASGG